MKEYKEYYRSGNPYRHYTHEGGVKHGDSKWWWENGVLRSYCHYVQGEMSGHYFVWYNNGQLKEHTFYLNDKPHGFSYFWRRDSSRIASLFYHRGRDITHEILKEFSILDLSELTDEQQTIIALKYSV